MRTGRGSSVSRRTVLFSEGGGGRHGSAPGGSCTRSPAAEQHRLLPKDEWRSAQGSEQRYGQGKGHAQAGSDECSVHARPFSAEVSRRQHGAGIHTNLLKAGGNGGVRALTYFTVCLADSRHRYGLRAVRRSWLQAADQTTLGYLQTAGRWPWKSEPAKECVTLTLTLTLALALALSLIHI